MRYANQSSEFVAHRSVVGPEEKSARLARANGYKSQRDYSAPDPYFESSALALAFVSSDGKYLVRVNRAFAELHKSSPEDLTNAPIEMLVEPTDHSRLAPIIRDTELSGRTTYEIKHRRVNWGPFHAQVDVTLVRNDERKVVYRTMHVRDISSLKQAEAKQLASESRYRNLIENSTDYLYETDLCGRFRYFKSRATTGFLGYSVGEMGSLRLLDLVHPNYRSTVASTYRKQLEENTLNTYQEFPVHTKEGRVVWIGQSVTLINESSGLILFVALARDITDRKLSKGRRRQSQIELEDLQDWYVATQTTVALAHELNQPLNAVCSYNEAALRMLNSGNPYPEKLQHALSASVQQCERAGKVMRDLLAFLTKGHAPLSKDLIDVNSVVRQALVDMDEEARTDTITLKEELGSDLGVALAHRLHIEKVLGNLLRNSVEAIRASQDARRIITVQTALQKEFVLVTVRDTGPGFSKEQSAKILEPFYTSKDRGVGMGLPVSRALIEAHGGKLWAESGVGAVFRFTVPLAR